MFAPAWTTPSTSTGRSNNPSAQRQLDGGGAPFNRSARTTSSSSSSSRRSTQPPSRQQVVEEPSPPPSSNSSIEHLPLHNPDAQPCSPSILLNPLPVGTSSTSPKSKTTALLNKLRGTATDEEAPRIVGANGRRPSIVAQIVSVEAEPPAHFLQDNPDYHQHNTNDTPTINATPRSPPPQQLHHNIPGMNLSSPTDSNTSSSGQSGFSAMLESENKSKGAAGAAADLPHPPRMIPTAASVSDSRSDSNEDHQQDETRGRSPRAVLAAHQQFDRDAEEEGGARLARSTTSFSKDAKLRFAELPPGRRMYRSNSLSIGVAARARMISNQGGGSARPQPRYAGPQQWYQPGAPMPEDVYTYRDVQKGITKLWGKMRKRSPSASSSTTSTSSAEAKTMEAEAKGRSKEIEHIEEADESESLDEEAIELEEEEEEEEEGDSVPLPEGGSLGLDLGPREGSIGSGSTLGTEDVPNTPEDSDGLELSGLSIESTKGFTRQQKGKGVEGRPSSRLLPNQTIS